MLYKNETVVVVVEQKQKQQQHNKIMKDKIVEKIKEWSFESTAHGLPVIIRKKTWYTKITWSLFTALAIGLCCYMVAKTVIEYLQYDVVTKIRKEIKSNVPFPVVSVCNINPMVTPAASDYIRRMIGTQFNVTVNDSIDIMTNEHIDEMFVDWLHYQTFDGSFNESLKRSFGYDVKTFIPNAFYYNNLLNVTDKFEWFRHFHYGNCFRINADGEMKQVFLDEGLLFDVFLGIPDEFRSNLYMDFHYGAAIIVQDQEVFSYLDLGILIRPGSFTKIGFKRVESETLPGPYSDCQNADKVDTFMSREMNKLGIRYSRKDCLDLIMVKMAVDKLGCYDVRYPQILNAKPCNSYEIYLKLMDFAYNFTEYLQYCPYECETVEFEISLSSDIFPTHNFFNYKLSFNENYFKQLFQTENVTHEMFEKSMARILVKIDDLRVTHLSEAPTMSIPDLLANLGGTMGLFIGVSILSFVEIIELLVDLIFIVVGHTRGLRIVYPNQNA